MLIKFLYIDDERKDDIHPLVQELEHFSEGKLKIEHIRVEPMKNITNKFVEERFDGLIIDQKLDAANDDGITFDYWGTSLAQNFRTDMIGQAVPSSPIILMSNEAVYVEYYDADESAHNLFDFTVKKGMIATCENYASKVSKIIYNLADAYKIARADIAPKAGTQDYNPFELLGPLLRWDEQAYQYTDKRFIDSAMSKSKDTHALVSLILNSFVRSAGILVSEDMLATKLGIDSAKSPDWDNLLAYFDAFKYTGVFSTIKPRWWMSRVEDLWYEIYPNNQTLRALTATERVDAIKQIFHLDGLFPIIPKYTTGLQSDRFWVNCVVTGTPLDPSDALVANKVDLKPWEQPLYLDPETVYERLHQPKYSVHPDYQNKVKALYKRLTGNV